MVKSSKKGWSATLKEELGVSASPRQKQPGRRETRAAAERKANRRQKARRWIAYSGREALQQKVNSRLERLECTNYSDVLDKTLGDDVGAAEDSEDYSENVDSSSEDDSDFGGRAKKRTKTTSGAGKRKGNGKRAAAKGKKAKRPRKKVATTVKKHRVRSLAEILLDENASKLSRCNSPEDILRPDYVNSTVQPSRYPRRKFCAVTGQFANYKDPESCLYYSTLKSYRTLKEQPPSWVRSTGIAPYFEAMDSIRDDRQTLAKNLASTVST